MHFITLFFIFFSFADSVDHIQAGKYTDKTQCGLCGGRILCGALSESIQLDTPTASETKSILDFCFLKTTELQSKAREHKQWVSEEQKRYHKIADVVVKISMQNSKSKYTNKVLPTIKEKIQLRANYRLEKGFLLSEMKQAIGETTFKKWEEENLILPLLSFESYSQIKGRNKSAYNTYAENLFLSDPDEIVVEPNAYAFYYEGQTGSRNVASKTPVSEMTKEDLKKPHDYYNATDIDSFLEKIKLLTTEFCEKNSYQNVRQASTESLRKIAMSYGGETSFDKAYYFKSLKKDFFSIVDGSECPQKLMLFLDSQLAELPNPAIKLKISSIQGQVEKRKPASQMDRRKPVYCGFDINNYQDDCSTK